MWDPWKNYFFVPKKGVRGAISQKGGIGISQDIPQFGAFRIPIYVALSESIELDFKWTELWPVTNQWFGFPFMSRSTTDTL